MRFLDALLVTSLPDAPFHTYKFPDTAMPSSSFFTAIHLLCPTTDFLGGFQETFSKLKFSKSSGIEPYEASNFATFS